MASIAASFTKLGVSKSGSPKLKAIHHVLVLLILLIRAMANVADSDSRFSRSETCVIFI